MIVKQASL